MRASYSSHSQTTFISIYIALLSLSLNSMKSFNLVLTLLIVNMEISRFS